MGFPARGEFVKLGKGALFLALFDDNGDENGFEFIGNANSVSVSSDITNVEIYSSTEASASLIDRARTRINYTLGVSLNEFTLTNLKMFLAGTDNAKSQTSGTGDTVNLDNVKAGRYYDIGARQVTSVVVTKGSDPLVLGEDYLLNSEFGVVQFLEGGEVADDDDIVVTFNKPAITIDQVRIARSGNVTAHLLYLSDDANAQGKAAKDRLEVWKVDVAPDGELNLISEDYNAFSLSMAIMTDASNHPNDPYGTLDRVRE